MDERERAEATATAYEERLGREQPDRRRRQGAFYTPPSLVAWILDQALGSGVRRVLDPACGTGHFLVAAARRLGDVRTVHGSDLDREAVLIARQRLQAEDPSVPAAEIAARVRVADGLTAWQGHTFDAVIGNPPFLGQLRRRTAGRAGGLGAYTDTSAVFLHRALDLVGDRGTVALVQPLSVLGARDAGPVRAAVVGCGAVTGFWAADRAVFTGTPVLTCVPVVRRGGTQGPVATWHGAGFRRGPDVVLPDGEWGGLAAPAFGVPAVQVRTGSSRVADLATCTADFRDQYYGLVPHVREAGQGGQGGQGGAADGEAPLITSGLIEPAACEWGRRPTRFARQQYAAPVVDLAGVRAGPLALWAGARLVPKLLVAGQGRVVEAVADERGEWLPSVPVVSVAPHDPADLWRLLAVLLAPPLVANAAARYLGTGLTSGSVKLSARQLAALPLPADDGAWAAGADLARRAQQATEADRPRLLAEVGTAMTAAYGVRADADARGWWLARALGSPGRGGQRPREG